MEQKRLQDNDLRLCFKRDAAAWDLTDKRTDAVNEKMWKVSQVMTPPQRWRPT